MRAFPSWMTTDTDNRLKGFFASAGKSLSSSIKDKFGHKARRKKGSKVSALDIGHP